MGHRAGADAREQTFGPVKDEHPAMIGGELPDAGHRRRPQARFAELERPGGNVLVGQVFGGNQGACFRLGVQPLELANDGVGETRANLPRKERARRQGLGLRLQAVCRQ